MDQSIQVFTAAIFQTVVLSPTKLHDVIIHISEL